MDSGTSKILLEVLSRRELDKIPNESATKIEKFFDERFEEFLTSQALHESSTREHDKRMHEYEKLVQELTTKNEDCEVKLEASQQNTVELRKQLDAARADVNRYQTTISKLEADNVELRRQRDNLTNERDSLQSTLESRCTEIERIKRDVQELDKQLKAAINAKYDAIAKYDEIQAKEASREYKERRMEQDRSIMQWQSQLQSLTKSYNSNLEELKAIQREKQQNRHDLESKLTEKIEELSIASSTVAHLQETNQTLLNRIEELSAKCKEEADEAMKMIDCYKNELLAKTKLADKIAKKSESQLKDMNDRYTEYRTKAEKELKELNTSETDLLLRVAELETEIKLQITDAKLSNSDNSEQLTKAQLELKEAYQKISENNTTIRDLREQVNLLSAEVKSANEKYTKAMMHTSDLQSFTVCKDQLTQIQEQIEQLTAERDQAVSALTEIKEGTDTTVKLLNKEKEEVERRLNDLTAQNTALLNKLQSLSSTLSACKANESAGEGASEISSTDSICNRSINDADGRDQLMTIIKYLRSEKDVALANVDVLHNENIRITSEMKILKDKLQELTESSNQASAASQENPLTTAEYQEVLRKLETLNAVTDSNRMLRDERDQLQQRIREITARNTKVEQEMFPLRGKNRELSAKTDDLSSENAKLRQEANQWRQRANALVERSNKNPEDFKRLQNERENLAKMLTAEKEKIERFEAELTSVRQDKTRLDNELATLSKSNQALAEEKRKSTEDIAALKQSMGRISSEIIEAKNKLLQRDDELKKMVDELAAKDALLTDSRNKGIQIRKIAKKYKDSFFELQNKEDERKAEQAARPIEQQAADVNESGQSRAQTEKLLIERIKELDDSMTEKLEENDLLRAETESLNKKLKEREDSHSNVLKELNHTIVTLTEEKKNMTRELAVTKTSLLNCEVSRTEHDALKVQNETRISRPEKELADMDKENKETISRLTRENETLQQGAKPTTSTSVIEMSPSDPVRTANVKPMAGPSNQQSAAVTPVLFEYHK